MKYYFVSGIQNGKYMASAFSAENKGEILADMSKSAIMINCIDEITKEEHGIFVKKMNATIQPPPKKKIIVPK